MKRIKKALVILMTGILFFSLLPISGSASPIKDFFKEEKENRRGLHRDGYNTGFGHLKLGMSYLAKKKRNRIKKQFATDVRFADCFL